MQYGYACHNHSHTHKDKAKPSKIVFRSTKHTAKFRPVFVIFTMYFHLLEGIGVGGLLLHVLPFKRNIFFFLNTLQMTGINEDITACSCS